ncbi:MAG: alpha-N-acetylglucosaminidase [Bacteroidota bacterium]|nr:alpha-N-acetylglucosaminidase [Bacteroidota bacterium]MDP4204443.1 alpha-N-acetylglucosaminidase [Bacteroidota bacterium]
MRKLFFCILFITFNLMVCGTFTPSSGMPVQKETDFNPATAREVLSRVMGAQAANIFVFKKGFATNDRSTYSIKTENGKVIITGNTTEALCRGCYDFLKNGCHSIVSWSGNRIQFPKTLPNYTAQVESPFKYHYYFNVVTHGYTTPYWDWSRWEKEIDWMALHGLNMPLIPGAHEAILYRTFVKLGLTKEETDTYFTGPAHFPWNRMGNITGWDGPLPASYFDKQIKLTHQILDRMRALGMKPIVPAFAGFVPEAIKRLYPDVSLRQLSWGGFDKKYQAAILAPDSKLFRIIGAAYIREWEKEFGKNTFYLADSFNEMDVPISKDPQKALEELSMFGNSVYQSITDANPNAVWVMQGWTFPFFRVKDELLWTPQRLNALCSKIPDDKLLILDLANEYNRLTWKIDPSWKMYEGFFGKMWIYSFIPNMGGKVPLNGMLDLYASMPNEALTYEKKRNLKGFGFAPEGIENNDIIYELLSDISWTNKPINVDHWLDSYCLSRYGSNSPTMKQAWKCFRKSCFGTFDNHPRFTYQFRPTENESGSVNKSKEFFEGVRLFMQCSKECKGSKLYTYDAIEFAAQYLGLIADEKLALYKKNPNDQKSFNEAMDLMTEIDRLFASHPNHRLSRWVSFARKWGDNEKESDYYESNAKRLITTWGGDVNEYSARTWSGLIKDYYKQRWTLFNTSADKENKDKLLQWEEAWIKKPWRSSTAQFKDPIEEINTILKTYKDY